VTQYGVTIRNKIKVPLHVSLFYFDCSDLSITTYYIPPAIGEKAQPSLPGSGILPIGYGDGGGLPYRYFLREGQNLDVGFLKLFISTESVDFECIPQPSAFDQGRGGSASRQKPKPIWDTQTITVVQRQPGSKLPTNSEFNVTAAKAKKSEGRLPEEQVPKSNGRSSSPSVAAPPETVKLPKAIARSVDMDPSPASVDAELASTTVRPGDNLVTAVDRPSKDNKSKWDTVWRFLTSPFRTVVCI